MPTITIDGQTIECRKGIPVLQAALDAGLNVPHYCYHPGLSVVASCRLCLMEMKMPHPQTRELEWAPKLFPSCQTMVRDGLEVRFNSERVRQNQKRVMEYYLLNHPLDCPVCDKAGECYLQDYAEHFGEATSRMVEDKYKNPKKDIGPRTLLYSDRCVLCGRCVRFAREIAGTAELAVTNRGSRGEIDVFPGRPLENKLQGNVVDLCPVGALLSKDFLFKRRVWLLQEVKSVCPGCSRGCTVHVDQHENRVYRLRPRYNEKVNEWWMCDDGRFGFSYIHRDDRLDQPRIRRGAEWAPARWEELPEILRFRFEHAARTDDGATVAAVLSPMMSCEEAWLLARFIRDVAPRAALVLGPVPVEGEDETFPKGNAGVPPASGFAIKAERCPNRRGIERIIEHFGGATLTFGDFATQAGEGKYKAAYIVGGYPNEWATKDCAKALAKVEFLVVHDLFASPLDATATVQIPSASWAEREGSFVNCDGLLQPFERAIVPPEGVKADGQFFYELCGERGLFRAANVREALAAALPTLGEVYVPPDPPKHAH
jgi:NADH-quinone oxidoreductase subunit G